MVKVAFQGEKGAFSEDAAIKFFGAFKSLSCHTFADTFDLVSRSKADFAVVPIENSQAGSINDTYDLLLKHRSVGPHARVGRKRRGLQEGGCRKDEVCEPGGARHHRVHHRQEFKLT